MKAAFQQSAVASCTARAGIAGHPGCAAAVLRGSFVALAKRVKQQGIQREGTGGSPGTTPVAVGLLGTGSPWKGSGSSCLPVAEGPQCGAEGAGGRTPGAGGSGQLGGAGSSGVLGPLVPRCLLVSRQPQWPRGAASPFHPPGVPLVPLWLLQDLRQVLVFAHRQWFDGAAVVLDGLGLIGVVGALVAVVVEVEQHQQAPKQQQQECHDCREGNSEGFGERMGDNMWHSSRGQLGISLTSDDDPDPAIIMHVGELCRDKVGLVMRLWGLCWSVTSASASSIPSFRGTLPVPMYQGSISGGMRMVVRGSMEAQLDSTTSPCTL